jgi:hypothetical protein
MTRILTIAIALSILCPTLCAAADTPLTPMQRLAALTTSTNTEKKMTPLPGTIRTACYGNHYRCDSAQACPSQCCPPSTYTCDNNGYCECYW